MALDVKIGINPISWMNDDLPSLGADTPIETALAEGSRIGYQGFELGGRFPKEAAALRAKLSAYGLACVSGWYSGRLAGRSVEEEIREVEPHLRLLTGNEAQVMVYGEVQDSIQGNLSAPLRERPRFGSLEAFTRYGERLTAFGRHLLGRGIRLAYHHHMGAYVQAPEDVDTLMAVTGEEVGLLIDTGHATFAGSDPAAMLAKHTPRVCHVHLKDVRRAVMETAHNRAWSFLQSVLNGVFTVPGDGSIDFAPVMALLDRANYRGWLVVEAEQDPAVAHPYTYAKKGFEHVDGLVKALRRGAVR